MEFRPCIDIHNGRVKQIVGGSLRDQGNTAAENFVAEKSSTDYALMYRSLSLKGGHVILLNAKDSEYYEESKREVLNALKAWPGGLMAGGGIDDLNAGEFLDAGASHVIATSFVFRNGKICIENLERLSEAVGKDRLCLDVSCRKRDGQYYVVTDRWQIFTEEVMDAGLLDTLRKYCSEFLVHAVDVEGKQSGIEEELIPVLLDSPLPVTYAGGVGSLEDVRRLREIGQGRINFTVGSALRIFGGSIEIDDLIKLSTTCC